MTFGVDSATVDPLPNGRAHRLPRRAAALPAAGPAGSGHRHLRDDDHAAERGAASAAGVGSRNDGSARSPPTTRSSGPRTVLHESDNQAGPRDGQAAPDARALLAGAAARADDLVLDEPLQRLLGQGLGALDPGASTRSAPVRAHAFGKFQRSCSPPSMAPAMLEYLDNAQSAAGHLNENYARELMELHTLGVNGGASGSRYSQHDVQELARVLTGVGINATASVPRLPALRQSRSTCGTASSSSTRPATTSAPRRCSGDSFPAAASRRSSRRSRCLSQDPATARFISKKLATYFVADDPPPRLVETMTETFRRSDGDIAVVLRVLFLVPELRHAPGRDSGRRAGKFKSPLQFVVSSLRLAYDGQGDQQLQARGQLALAAGGTALRARDAGRLCAGRAGVDEFGPAGDALRDRPGDRRGQRRPLQSRRTISRARMSGFRC